MKTLTATEARKNLTRWLKAAKGGEEIGIVYGADIFAIRRVPIHAADYPQAEYGLSADQLADFKKRADSELDRELKGGQMKPFTGKLPRGRAR